MYFEIMLFGAGLLTGMTLMMVLVWWWIKQADRKSVRERKHHRKVRRHH